VLEDGHPVPIAQRVHAQLLQHLGLYHQQPLSLYHCSVLLHWDQWVLGMVPAQAVQVPGQLAWHPWALLCDTLHLYLQALPLDCCHWLQQELVP
jgi:hypothetical protein